MVQGALCAEVIRLRVSYTQNAETRSNSLRYLDASPASAPAALKGREVVKVGFTLTYTRDGPLNSSSEPEAEGRVEGACDWQCGEGRRRRVKVRMKGALCTYVIRLRVSYAQNDETLREVVKGALRA